MGILDEMIVRGQIATALVIIAFVLVFTVFRNAVKK